MEKTRENNTDLLRIICCISVIIINVTVGYVYKSENKECPKKKSVLYIISFC